MKTIRIVLSLFFCLCLLISCNNVSPGSYAIVTDSNVDDKVEYAIHKLERILKTNGFSVERVDDPEKASCQHVIVVGLSPGTGYVAGLVRSENKKVPAASEALAIWKTKENKKNILAIAGYDAQGVMYGVLDVAVRAGWNNSKDFFKEVKEVTEQPRLATRAISMYTMNRTVWEDKFYDTAYWEKYFDMLSENRFNSFVIIFGYENGGFLAPPYPYFFDVEEFPDVKMVGLTAEQQQKNLDTLNNLIELAHRRGIKLSVAIWDHIYRGGIQSGGMSGLEKAGKEPLHGLVWGVTGENLIAYTKAALSHFLERVPKLDGVEFRMHGESGLRHGEQEGFWKDVFKSMKATAPDMHFVLRAKDMPESVVQAAIHEGINFRIETKYWMEQMGLPYHSTHINRQNQKDRRQSYADMLRYPQEYKMYWRLWNGGTTRILLWGNPDYAARFVESAKLYDGDTYEVTEPLATKMGSMPHDMKSFDLLAPQYRYYEYEFERYWHFFQVFGRMGYSQKQTTDIWDKEFEKRFGKKAGAIVKEALHEASWILPRIVASSYPYGAFPTTRGWAEKQCLGELFEFAKAEGSDIQQFASFDEEAKLLIENGVTAKIRPSTNSLWFKRTSDNLNELIHKAEEVMGNHTNKEFFSTMTDLKILSKLALYHSRRTPAAVNYRLFVHSKDVAALDKAIAYEKDAIAAWKQIVDAAGDVYASDLMMGVRSSFFDGLTHRLSGHWKEELEFLEKGLVKLEKERNEYKADGKAQKAPEYKAAQRAANSHLFRVNLDRVEEAPANKPITIRAKVAGDKGVEWVHLRYRSVNQTLDYSMKPMTATSEKDVYEVTIPVNEIDTKFDFMYFVEVMDKEGNGLIYPELMEETPYVIVNFKR